MTGALPLLLDARRARKEGPDALAQRQRDRLAQMVAFARDRSPYYRELYRGLPDTVDDPTVLPVTSKKELMARFDDWTTDRQVTIDNVRALVDDPDRIGERFLGKYTVITTSGTTGVRGIFLMDDRAMAVTDALAVSMINAWLGGRDLLRLLARGARMAMVIATGGHFATTVAATRMSRSPLGRRKVQVFPVHTPLPEMVGQLNQFRPAVVAAYASMAKLLASEQEAGRLQINPVLISVTAEGLALDEYDRIGRAFHTKVRNGYAANECPFLSYGCEHKWLHVNSDWVVLEPVEADYQPTPAGQQSHTVLLSNLANRTQPILRYDLGDSIVWRPDRCPCGNPLPAVRVQGRAADVLTFPTDRDQPVSIAPLVFGTLVDRIPGIEMFQIVQTAQTSLRVRLRVAAGADTDHVWQTIRSEISRVLEEHGLAHVTVERAEEPPEQSTGGKYREVIPLTPASR